jgi:NAD(P)-dependent dehydrogenase (short-subunit alcohol dehydrogenase family)
MLTNETIMITGASHGLGKSLALFCAKANAKVILLASNERALEQCFDEIVKLNKQTPLICTFNLESATADDYQNLYQIIEEEQLALTGLFHAAAQLKSLTPLEHTSLLQWHRIMQINTNARFALTQTLLPLLKKSERARLGFLLSDQAHIKGQAYWGTYQVSEQACRTMAEILTAELSDTGVQVNTIQPPACPTKLRKQAFPFEDPTKLIALNQLDDFWQTCFDQQTQHGEHISY